MATTTETTLPSYLEKPTKTALGGVENFLNSGSNYVYGSKPGESLYTGLSEMQKKSLGNVDWLSNQDLGASYGFDKAQSMWDQYASSNSSPSLISGFYGAQQLDPNAYGGVDTSGIVGGGVAGQIDTSKYGQQGADLTTGRVVDQNGPLGKISDYMDPYLAQVLAPILQAQNESLQQQQRQLASSSIMSGAFGGARQGILEGQNNLNANRAVNETTGKVYSDAYNTAIGQRQADVGRMDATNQFNTNVRENAATRMLGADTTNLGAKENALVRNLDAEKSKASFADAGVARTLSAGQSNQSAYNSAQERALQVARDNQAAQQRAIDNLGTAANATAALGKGQFDMFNDVNDSLFNSGKVVQDDAEAQRKATEAFQTALKDKKYNDAIKLLQATNGTPMANSTTQTTTNKSDAGIWGLLGSLAGAIL